MLAGAKLLPFEGAARTDGGCGSYVAKTGQLGLMSSSMPRTTPARTSKSAS